MPSLGRSLPLAFQLLLSPACLAASGRGWAGPQSANSPQSFVLWASWQCLRLELFPGKFSLSLFPLFFPPSLAIPWFGLLSHVSYLRLSSGHSGPVLTLSNAAHASLSLLVVDVSIWATSPLGAAVRHVICGFYLFIFSSWYCCPLRFQNYPQTHGERVSWCLETSLLRLPPWDGSLSLTLLSLF